MKSWKPKITPKKIEVVYPINWEQEELMSKLVIPTLEQIRAGINSLEGIDEETERAAILKPISELSDDEIMLVTHDSLGAMQPRELFGDGFLLGLATARQFPTEPEKKKRPYQTDK
jgi:hypothetical protein